MTDTFQNLIIRVCVDCGFGFANPEPSDKDIAQYYEIDYRNETSPFYVDFRRHRNAAPKNVIDARSISQISLATMFTDFVEGSTFLDLGPGLGLSFESAKQMLRQPNLYGVELNLDSKQYYQSVYGANSGSLDEFVEAGGGAQIALMSHSLEHFTPSHLAPILTRLREGLAPNGVLVIEVPFDDLRDNFDAARPQTPHVSFFSPDSLKRFLIFCGWDVVYISQCAQLVRHNACDSLEPKHVNRQHSKVRRYLVRYLPRFGMKAARALRAALAEFRGSSPAGSLHSFVYGSERDCIRVVVRPKEK
jgi:SAM-dependent methyltransferase